MPPKRKKAAGAEDAPEPKKRVTRSATKATTSDQTVTKLDPAKPARKAVKPIKANPSKVKNTKASKPEPKAENEPSENVNGATNLTINDDSVKSPIACHHYPHETEKHASNSTLIFTHGAGGTISAPAVVNFCTGYSNGAPVLAFQGSMNLKARAKGFHACISHLEAADSKADSMVLGGRSMGARAAVIAATENLSSSSPTSRNMNLILASYPLKGPKDDIRDQILIDLPSSVRVLFISGDKDAMCPLDILNKTRKRMAAKSQLVVVKGADHGMHVKPKGREKQTGQESGLRAFEWVEGKMDAEIVEIMDRESAE